MIYYHFNIPTVGPFRCADTYITMFFIQKYPTFSTLCCNKSFVAFLNLEIGISKDIPKVLYCIVLYDEGQSKPICNGASERHSSEGFRKPHTTLAA